MLNGAITFPFFRGTWWWCTRQSIDKWRSNRHHETQNEATNKTVYSYNHATNPRESPAPSEQNAVSELIRFERNHVRPIVLGVVPVRNYANALPLLDAQEERSTVNPRWKISIDFFSFTTPLPTEDLINTSCCGDCVQSIRKRK